MSKTTNPDEKLLRLLQIFSAKLVLEVFGGAGAIWGFSEAVGLRVASNVWFWRPCALTVGTIFFARWLCQIQDYIIEEDLQLFGGKGEKKLGKDDVDLEHVALAPSKNKKLYTDGNLDVTMIVPS
mmetsp:Transcript_5260/g.9661  ORF Transcript_5260/g.9661 Transcript_5260/m.9661 type:complete len:125 (+) Transcript_5260:115-489(+)|eukprot:CAMPEP_0183732444 /NCGR_PEP_ID=MMETSP0737-20130205/38521_1 /TAXON_ID=385413 /ORGANISM="Thalassiosira miniscula, Strain CCMP1093" /LENGTH=124 /DNA_ID=CAMNT_0025965467 /DNA_START=74 /DNA_END=448 /DNA_ORIENTATION=+